jgi:hypothetical protein
MWFAQAQWNCSIPLLGCEPLNQALNHRSRAPTASVLFVGNKWFLPNCFVFRLEGQIGRNAEFHDVANNRKCKTKFSHPFSTHSGNCVVRDRQQFPYVRARRPHLPTMAAERAETPLSIGKECARSHTGSAGRRAHTMNGPSVNNHSW